jgi:hypothetical protein
MRNFVIAIAVAVLFNVAAAQHKHGEHEKHKLGRKIIGDHLVSVIVIGGIDHDEQIDFDIKLIDAKTEPTALRVWIGTEDAKGSEKAEGKKGKTTYIGKVNVPKPLPTDAKLWVELVTSQATNRGSFDLEEHGHKH